MFSSEFMNGKRFLWLLRVPLETHTQTRFSWKPSKWLFLSFFFWTSGMCADEHQSFYCSCILGRCAATVPTRNIKNTTKIVSNRSNHFSSFILGLCVFLVPLPISWAPFQQCCRHESTRNERIESASETNLKWTVIKCQWEHLINVSL